MFCIPEMIKPIEALNPATDAAGRTGDYISLKNSKKAYVIAQITQGNAAVVPITIEQATAVAGTASKPITNAVPIYSNLDTAATDTLVRAADAVAYSTDAGLKNKVVVFCIDPAKLDTEGGFDCITVKTAASNALNITAATYLVDLDYAGATPPSNIID